MNNNNVQMLETNDEIILLISAHILEISQKFIIQIFSSLSIKGFPKKGNSPMHCRLVALFILMVRNFLGLDACKPLYPTTQLPTSNRKAYESSLA